MELRKAINWSVVIVVSAIFGGAVMLGLDSLHSSSSSGSNSSPVIEKAVAPPVTGVSSTAGTDLANLYAQVRPSVVEIDGQSTNGNGGDTGSGIILDTKGHILTNYHVINGYSQLSVTFADNNSYPAKVVGTDPGDDLAVLQVNAPASELKPAVFGDSSKVKIGESVIAVGNPFGLEGSVTQGIISGMGRTLNGSNGARPLRQLLQSDAAINPGNSGGGLFDMNGDLIGITSAIENPSGQRVFAGVGYAIPVNDVTRFLPDMLAGKTVQHPELGVSLTNVTPALASQLGLSVKQGVLVTSVQPNTGAAQAGLVGGDGTRGVVGDVITAIDGKQVKDYNDLANYIDSKNVGDKVRLSILRNGKQQTVDVTLGAWAASA